MSSVFVGANQEAEVKFYIRSTKGSVNIVKAEDYSKLSVSERDKCEECLVTLKPLSWGRYCQLQGQSMIYDHATTLRHFDHERYSMMKLLAIISSWSFVMENVKKENIPVRVNEESVNALHPVVAEYLLKEYSSRFEYSEEQRKN